MKFVGNTYRTLNNINEIRSITSPPRAMGYHYIIRIFTGNFILTIC